MLSKSLNYLYWKKSAKEPCHKFNHRNI